jgi:hypothetical protein
MGALQEEFPDEVGEVDSPVAPDVAAGSLLILVRVALGVKIFTESSVVLL